MGNIKKEIPASGHDGEKHTISSCGTHEQIYENILVSKIIERIRTSFDNSFEVYTSGSCVKFCMILKEIFPKGKILYDCNHAIFELNNLCYDITVEVAKVSHIPIEEYGILKAYDLMNLKYKP